MAWYSSVDTLRSVANFIYILAGLVCFVLSIADFRTALRSPEKMSIWRPVTELLIGLAFFVAPVVDWRVGNLEHAASSSNDTAVANSIADVAPLNQPVRTATALIDLKYGDGADVRSIEKTTEASLTFSHTNEPLSVSTFVLTATGMWNIFRETTTEMSWSLLRSKMPSGGETVGQKLASLDKCVFSIQKNFPGVTNRIEILEGVDQRTFSSQGVS
jgi:hypothetical protein